MTLLARIRQRQTPWAQRVLGLFVVVWLNMALQPCAMAMGASHQHDFEHCPPGTLGETLPPDEGDSHCGAPQDDPCNITGGRCAFLDDYDYDGRTVQIKVKHAPSDVPLGFAPSVTTSPLLNGAPVFLNADDPTKRSGIRPQLNVLFCIYQI